MLSRFSEKITPIINAIKNSDTLGKKIFIDLIFFATDLIIIQKEQEKNYKKR